MLTPNGPQFESWNHHFSHMEYSLFTNVQTHRQN